MTFEVSENIFDHENTFWLGCAPQRLAKTIAHYQLYNSIKDIEGAFIECGLFKGVSFRRFLMMRELFDTHKDRQFHGFDTFGKFPETNYEEDKQFRKKFIDDAGLLSASKTELLQTLARHDLDHHVNLIEGDILETVPQFIRDNPKQEIAFLHIDTDIYEPAKIILEMLYPKLVPGGLLVLDNYDVFPGETKAVQEYFVKHQLPLDIKRFDFCKTPHYHRKAI